MEKIIWVLKSRKWWASVIGLLIATGALQLSDSQEAELVGAILTVATAVGYMASIAIEDAGRHMGSGGGN